MSIVAIEQYYVHLATGFAIGAINSDEYQEAMEAFKFRDDEDRYWTVGAATGQWYVHDGDDWTAGDPPPELMGADIPLWDVDGLMAEEEASSSAATTTQPESAESVEAGPRVSPPGLLVCSNPSCGKPMREGPAFCPSCGHQRESSSPAQEGPSTTLCPNTGCGKPVPPGSEFCVYCGTGLT